MGRIIESFEEFQTLTSVQLVSDAERIQFNPRFGPITYRELQERTAREPHRCLCDASLRHFLSLGYDVHPYGVGIDGIMSMSDLAIAKNNRVLLVECLSAQFVTYELAQRKRKMESHFQLIFVVEDPGTYSPSWTRDRYPNLRVEDCSRAAYKGRVNRLSLRNRTYVLSDDRFHLSRPLKPYPARVVAK
jgi:hypothetical protein